MLTRKILLRVGARSAPKRSPKRTAKFPDGLLLRLQTVLETTGLTAAFGDDLAFGYLTQTLAATRFFLLVMVGDRPTVAPIQVTFMAAALAVDVAQLIAVQYSLVLLEALQPDLVVPGGPLTIHPLRQADRASVTLR